MFNDAIPEGTVAWVGRCITPPEKCNGKIIIIRIPFFFFSDISIGILFVLLCVHATKCVIIVCRTTLVSARVIIIYDDSV